MTTERESNRLPLRAGAMLLLAAAVVFFGLGVHRLTAAPVDDAPPPPSAATSAAAPQTSAKPITVDPSSTKVCVVNAGEVAGLASSVTQQLKTKGYQTAEPANLASSATLSENTIFFRAGDEAVAKQVATALGGGYSVEPRPSGATKLPACTEGVLVIAITE